MNAHRAACSAMLAIAAVALAGAAQGAGLFRAYLASTGVDSNPCTVASPCRLLPAALAAVADGGEIWMLDSANYNTAPVSIAKSVTILAVPGAIGSVVAVGGGDAIDAATPGTTIALRNLVIVPLPGASGGSGVAVNGIAKLTVEDSHVSGLFDGIVVLSPTAVRIVNCTIRDNTANGVELHNGATAEIAGTKFLGNFAQGIYLFTETAALTTASISDSILSASATGLNVEAVVSGATSRAFVTRSTFSGNSVGIESNTPGPGTTNVTVSNIMVVGNGTGFSISGAGANMETLGNNALRQNGTPWVGVLTSVLMN